MSPEAFGAGITILEDIYPKSLTEAATGVYNDLCGHLTDQVWIAAIKRVCGTSRFFPVPAEILTAAQDVVAEAHGVLPPDAAWRAVHGVARSWGQGMSVRSRFDAATWQALQAIGGISVVAMAEDGAEIGRIERQFRDAYRREFERTTERLLEAPLPDADRLLAIGGSS